jgi:Fe-S-cluster containining protein
VRTVLALGDRLPLTCTRSGTCCHGKDIRITPWELALLARARDLPAREFRDRFTEDAGTRLRLDGPGWRGLPACSQYDPARGCTVHAARPLACRLYPLGREVQGGEVRIIHEGSVFPCLDGCPEVSALPSLTVAAYLAGQGAEPFAEVRDAYLELAQDLADAAFTLVFDGGIGAGADRRWANAWRVAVDGGPAAWPQVLGAAWHDRLTIPEIAVEDAGGWPARHHDVLLELAGQAAPAVACVRLFSSALLLLHAVGGDAAVLGRRWLAQAGA